MSHQGHGRLEVRAIWTSPQMNEWFEPQWAGITQVFRLRRRVTTKDKTREEVIYGFTNLPRKKANAQRLLALEQEHWLVANKLHSRRDVALGEDGCQVRVAGAPPVLAELNGGVLALMDWLHVSNVASQMRRMGPLQSEQMRILFETHQTTLAPLSQEHLLEHLLRLIAQYMLLSRNEPMESFHFISAAVVIRAPFATDELLT